MDFQTTIQISSWLLTRFILSTAGCARSRVERQLRL